MQIKDQATPCGMRELRAAGPDDAAFRRDQLPAAMDPVPMARNGPVSSEAARTVFRLSATWV